MKKRLMNKERVEFLKSKLKTGGFISFASDIEDYFENVKKIFLEDKELIIQNTDFFAPACRLYNNKISPKIDKRK